MKLSQLKQEIKDRMEREEDILFEVANLFTRVRLEKGLTEKALAKLLKTKQPGVARWESGAIVPNVKILIKLAEIAGKKLEIKLK